MAFTCRVTLSFFSSVVTTPAVRRTLFAGCVVFLGSTLLVLTLGTDSTSGAEARRTAFGDWETEAVRAGGVLL